MKIIESCMCRASSAPLQCVRKSVSYAKITMEVILKPPALVGTGNYKNITQTPLGNIEHQTHETLILKKSVGDLFC